MEAVKYVLMYAVEAVVIALVGITLFAGLYQLIREKVLESRRSRPEAAPQPAER